MCSRFKELSSVDPRGSFLTSSETSLVATPRDEYPGVKLSFGGFDQSSGGSQSQGLTKQSVNLIEFSKTKNEIDRFVLLKPQLPMEIFSCPILWIVSNESSIHHFNMCSEIRIIKSWYCSQDLLFLIFHEVMLTPSPCFTMFPDNLLSPLLLLIHWVPISVSNIIMIIYITYNTGHNRLIRL